MELEEYMKTQLSERYRCFILCGGGLTGKTELVMKAAKSVGGKYIDVLKQFSEEPPGKAIDSMRPEQFFGQFKLEEGKLIVFDNMDFLFALWTENQQREFIRKLDMKSNGTSLVAVLHNYKLLEETGLMKNNSKGQKRIVNIAEFI